MRRLIPSIAVAMLGLGMARGAAAAGTSASHTVTIQVRPVNAVHVNGNSTIRLEWTGTRESLEGSDRSATLSWVTNASSSSPKKITAHVAEALPEGVTLKVRADVGGKATHGASAAAQELSTNPVEVVSGIYAEVVREAPLRYEASVAGGADLRNDVVRTVTYTITD
jgi:hypothetical protein